MATFSPPQFCAGDLVRVRLPGIVGLFRVPPEHRTLLGRVGFVSFVDEDERGEPLYTLCFDERGDVVVVDRFREHELARIVDGERRFGA